VPESKFSKPTDSVEEIKLESALIYADWRQGAAYAGRSAGFEVVTVFVGNGAKIEISGKSEKGKKLGKIKGEMEANRYVGSFDIPDDIEPGDQISFEAKLSANNINGESSAIPVYPAPVVTNMKWSAKEAKRGDRLRLTADVDKVPGGTEALVTIFEYDRDGAHDKIAEIPAMIKDLKLDVEWEYEYHEDVDEIPTEREMREYGTSYNPPEYFFAVRIGGAEYGTKQESGLLLFKDWIEVELLDDKGRPVPDTDYILRLPDGAEKRGRLDAAGKARVEDVPPGKFKIVFPNWEE
jgi:hypothetical protein